MGKINKGLAEKMGEVKIPDGKIELIKVRMPVAGNPEDEKCVNDMYLTFIDIQRDFVESIHNVEEELFQSIPKKSLERTIQIHKEFLHLVTELLQFCSNQNHGGATPRATLLIDILLLLNSYLRGKGAFFGEVFEEMAGIVIQYVEQEKFNTLVQ